MLPQPGTARHVVGMFLPNALLKALAQVKPEQAMAEGSGAVWTMQVNGNHDDGRPFITAMFTYAGGVGARAAKPGLSACSYPTGVAAVPVEVVEASAPIRFLRKELRPDSGGAGAQPGGLGQTIEFSVDTTGHGSSTPSPVGWPWRPRASSAAGRVPPVVSVSTTNPSPRRPASPCSPATSCAWSSPAVAGTASPWSPAEGAAGGVP